LERTGGATVLQEHPSLLNRRHRCRFREEGTIYRRRCGLSLSAASRLPSGVTSAYKRRRNLFDDARNNGRDKSKSDTPLLNVTRSSAPGGCMRRREFITLLGCGGGVAARGTRAAAGSDAADRRAPAK